MGSDLCGAKKTKEDEEMKKLWEMNKKEGVLWLTEKWLRIPSNAYALSVKPIVKSCEKLHKLAVKEALVNGELVPIDVLKEYGLYRDTCCCGFHGEVSKDGLCHKCIDWLDDHGGYSGPRIVNV